MQEGSKNNLEEYHFRSKMSLSGKHKFTTFLLLSIIGSILSAIATINIFATGGDPELFLPLSLVALVFFSTYAYAPTEVGIESRNLHIVRKVGAITIPLQNISLAKSVPNLRKETGFASRIFGSGGLWGYFGLFWSKNWGFFKLHITNNENVVVLELTEGRKVAISPDDRVEFLSELRKHGINVLL